jgi:replicative DNA helicase
VSLAQFNRQAADAIPGLHHIREAGLENEPSLVVALYVEPGQEKGEKIKLLLLKNRHGPCEDVELRWERWTGAFSDPPAFPADTAPHHEPKERDE